MSWIIGILMALVTATIVELHKIRRRLRDGWFGQTARKIGVFVMLYVSLGFNVILLLLYWGVNPTLVLSVIGAPLWIFILWAAWRLTKTITEDES